MASNALQINLLTLFAVTGAVVAIELSAAWWLYRSGLPSLIVMGLARLLQTICMLWIVIRLQGGLRAIGWAPGTWWPGLKQGARWSLVFAAVAGAGMALMQLLGLNPLNFIRQPLPGAMTDRMLLLLVGGLIGPIAEEICFRGVLYTFLRRWGILFAIIASTAIFAALHAPHGIPVTQIAGGLVFALAFEKTRNLMVPIVIHALGNLAIFGISWVF
jgi:uncharacterized protein